MGLRIKHSRVFFRRFESLPALEKHALSLRSVVQTSRYSENKVTPHPTLQGSASRRSEAVCLVPLPLPSGAEEHLLTGEGGSRASKLQQGQVLVTTGPQGGQPQIPLYRGRSFPWAPHGITSCTSCTHFPRQAARHACPAPAWPRQLLCVGVEAFHLLPALRARALSQDVQ